VIGLKKLILKLAYCITKKNTFLIFSLPITDWFLHVHLQDLKDGLNYGVFCPPVNGRAGKFLDEERLLKDYSLPGPIGYLEVGLFNSFKMSLQCYLYCTRYSCNVLMSSSYEVAVECNHHDDNIIIIMFSAKLKSKPLTTIS